MMSIKGILSTVLITSKAVVKVGAFSSLHCRAISRQTAQYGTVRLDATEDIADALRMSEEFGAISKEARVEMDSNNSRPAHNTKAASDAPQGYYGHIRSLPHLLKETNPKLAQMKQLVTQIKSMEVKDPSLARLPDGSNGSLKAGLADAKAAVEVFRPSSTEAKKAWGKLNICFGTKMRTSPRNVTSSQMPLTSIRHWL